ncbi:unnamed protein product [Protopolystoma xenopodis]|uniref:Uncharacterized protein n=1 Tax=Protopolystoma xenopodis TaxID=117903 RepID=A0A3S5B255_9PLAT|nr:unnamed protein product [Protopolystoma xenopodis]
MQRKNWPNMGKASGNGRSEAVDILVQRNLKNRRFEEEIVSDNFAHWLGRLGNSAKHQNEDAVKQQQEKIIKKIMRDKGKSRKAIAVREIKPGIGQNIYPEGSTCGTKDMKVEAKDISGPGMDHECVWVLVSVPEGEVTGDIFDHGEYQPAHT